MNNTDRPGQTGAATNNEAGPVEIKMSDEVVPAAIGQKLRELYDDVANAPVPERFMQLLEQLEQGGSFSPSIGPASDSSPTREGNDA